MTPTPTEMLAAIKARLSSVLEKMTARDSAGKVRKRDRVRRKRERRGRGVNSTPAIRRASRLNLRKSKQKRNSKAAQRRAMRTRRRRNRYRGK